MDLQFKELENPCNTGAVSSDTLIQSNLTRNRQAIKMPQRVNLSQRKTTSKGPSTSQTSPNKRVFEQQAKTNQGARRVGEAIDEEENLGENYEIG